MDAKVELDKKLTLSVEEASELRILSIVLRTFDFALPLSCRQLFNL